MESVPKGWPEEDQISDTIPEINPRVQQNVDSLLADPDAYLQQVHEEALRKARLDVDEQLRRYAEQRANDRQEARHQLGQKVLQRLGLRPGTSS